MHQGILFLDELPEFDRVLEVLREPLESGYIVIARAQQGTLSCAFSIGCGMNPCPAATTEIVVAATAARTVQRYRNKLLPLIDRIDLHITVARATSLRQPKYRLSSAEAVERFALRATTQAPRL